MPKTLHLNQNEVLQFQYILPVQGDFETLELVECILKKVNGINENLEVDIEFEDNEIKLVKNSIQYLNSQKMLNLNSLPLIRKFLNI